MTEPARGTEPASGTEAARGPAWQLADRVADAFFEAQPMIASYMGVSGHDDRLPDASAEGHERFRGRVLELYLESTALSDALDEREPADASERVIAAAARDRLVATLAGLDAPRDWSISTVPFVEGPAMLQFMLSQSVIADDTAASGYLERCRQIPAYLDQVTARRVESAARGQTPVAPLVEQAIRQCEQLAAAPEAAVGLSPTRGPSDEWRAALAEIARDVVQPALGRYIDGLRAAQPTARPPERAGLVWVPGGVAAYQSAVREGTTLTLDPAEVHRIGLEELAQVEERIREVGSKAYGVSSLDDVLDRLRSVRAPEEDEASLMARAVEVVRRAEVAAAAVLPLPSPPPCSVEPMPDAVADAGTPPMYRPPSRVGGRSGAYMMNTRRPGPAAGFMLETVTFHESVPGHHAQYAHLQQVGELPLLLSAFNVVPHGEGWGLYGELLADELGLYSSEEQRLGMLVSHAWRAVRLVVDTGLHWLGWSRAQALEFALRRTAMPEPFMQSEIDRYIAVPGQALGYLIGLREILSLRAEFRGDLRAFHTAVLGHGALPLPTLRQVVSAAATG